MKKLALLLMICLLFMPVQAQTQPRTVAASECDCGCKKLSTGKYTLQIIQDDRGYVFTATDNLSRFVTTVLVINQRSIANIKESFGQCWETLLRSAGAKDREKINTI